MIVEKRKDRLIWGIFLTFGGLFLSLGSLCGMEKNISLVFGIPLLVLGIIIVLNKSEDEIEKREDIKGN